MNKIILSDLSRRESERVEWKENVASIDNLIKTAVAFANDYSNLGGGYIVCGAKEGKDEQIGTETVTCILPANKIKVEKKRGAPKKAVKTKNKIANKKMVKGSSKSLAKPNKKGSRKS